MLENAKRVIIVSKCQSCQEYWLLRLKQAIVEYLKNEKKKGG